MFKKILQTIALIAILAFSSPAFAKTVTATCNWTYTGVNEIGGFRIETQLPGEDTWTTASEVTDVEARSTTWSFEAVEGRTLFRMLSFSDTETSDPSNNIPFEYMAVQGLPAPTIILHFQ